MTEVHNLLSAESVVLTDHDLLTASYAGAGVVICGVLLVSTKCGMQCYLRRRRTPSTVAEPNTDIELGLLPQAPVTPKIPHFSRRPRLPPRPLPARVYQNRGSPAPKRPIPSRPVSNPPPQVLPPVRQTLQPAARAPAPALAEFPLLKYIL